MKIWITKYAITQGILTADAEVKGRMAVVRKTRDMFMDQYYHHNDFHLTEDEAIAHAELMRKKRIASLEKQIKKLSAMRF